MSNALRDAMDYVAQGQRERAQQLEAENAANSNAVSRAWTGGRITGDLNAAQIDLAAARAQEDEQKAAALQQQVDNLQQRASLYAADVGKVEDIKGLRDAFSWFGTQVGQGAASMADPMALSAGATAIGAPLARAGGTAGLIGKAIQGAGHLGAFALNQRQMAGEHYGKLAQDPAALAQLGAKGAYDQSNLVGAAGGALETILPAMAGRALGGAALKKGAAGMLGTGVGRKTLYGMAGEGATEVAQGEISRQAHAYANPERDTNGDWSDRLNEFAGGAAGGALPSAAGAVADHGYARASRAGEVVNEKAGEVVDLANKGAQRAGEMYKDSGLKGVIDLGVEGGKTLWQRAAGKNGETQAQAEATQAAVDRFALTPEEEQVFRSVPPDTEDTDALHAWVQEDSAKREAAAGRRLADLAEQGVPEAGELLQRLQDPDPVTRAMAANDAGDFLLDRHAQSEVAKEATNFAAALGSYAARGAAAAGKAAWGVGKDLASGVKQGLADGGKKNLQGTANPVLNYDTWRAWTAENGAQGGSPKHAVASAAGRAQERSADAQFARAMKANSQHATHLGELFAAQAEEHFTSAGWQAPGIGNYARSLGYEAADMAASWLRTGSVGEAKVAGLTKDLYNTLGRDAGAVVARAAKAATPETHGFFTQLQERLDNYTPEARRGGLGDQMVALLPAAQQQELLANGGAGANMLENTVAQISRGRVLPAKRREVERAIGADNLNKMLSLYGDTLEEGPAQAPGKVVDDRAGGAENIDTDRLSVNDDGEVDADGQASGFEQRQAERKVQRNGTPRMYMFHGQGAHTLHSTDVQGARKPRNPFDSADKPSAMLAARIEKDARDLGFMRADGSEKLPSKPRPRLVEAASPEQAGELLAKKKGEMDKMLGGEGSGHYSEVVPAKQVLDDMGSSPTERLALFRDYMFQNARRKATSEKNPDPTGAADDVLLAVQAHAMLVDEMQGKDRELGVPGGKATRATPGGGVAVVGAWVKQNLGEKAYTQFRQNAQNMLRAAAGRPTRDYKQERAVNGVSDGDRALVMDAMERFFANNYLVQAERTDATVDRTPGEISAGEVVDMARSGARIRSAAEGAARTEGVPNNAEGGLLNFKQPGDQDLLGTNAKTLAIPVERLVGWVRSTRREESSKEDKRGADKKFVADLYEGITALLESRLVEGMPWVNGKKGPEHFLDVAKTPTKKAPTKKAPRGGRPVGHPGLPDALHLPTTTGWEANKRELARKEHVREEHAVARAAGATIEGAMRRSERRRAVDVAREQAVGEVSETPALEGAGDPYTDIVKNRVTPRHPLDRVTSPSKAGDAQTVKNQREQLDAEALDVGIRSKGIATPGFENRMSAEKKAPERADALIETFRSQGVAQGIAAVHRRLRMAQQSGQGGGIQYAWPLAHALTPKNIGMMDLSTGEARQMALARSGLANLIAGSENLSQREKVAMARAMADEAARPRITAQTAQAWLEKGAQMYRNAKAEKAAKAKAAMVGDTTSPTTQHVIEAVAADDYASIKSDADADAFIAAAKGALGHLDAVERRAEAAGTDLSAQQVQVRATLRERLKPGSTYDWASLYPSWAGDSSKYDERINEALGRAAPEVVAAGAPKSQPSPGGAAKGEHAVAQAAQGRKLSLLSTQVHNDLQKGGFAATHDSPIKHAGKFNWREHIGKGDGNAVYGAGTYLSTDEVIHRGYKKIFSNPAPGMRVDGVAQGQGTSAAPSPTYHVSVRIMPSQIMNWGAALSEQSGYVKKRLEQAGFKDPDATGAQMYHALSARLGSQAAASEHLQGLGILGHSYGSTPKRSPNYVIYDDGRIETNYVHFNKQGTSSDAGGAGPTARQGSGVASDADVKAAKDYLAKVLGPKFKSEFEAITGYSGEFIEAENLIRVSTLTNAGVMNVARHEALHAFWSQFVKGNPKAQRVLASLTDDPRVLRRLQALLKDEPDALQQLTDGEERLAYIYQFAMAGQLKLPHTPGTTLMHRVRKFLRRVFMMVRDDERAVDLLYAFEAGKMSEPTAGARAVAAALNQGTWAKGGARAMDAFTQRLASLTLPATTIMANSASPTVRKLGQMFWTNPGEEGSAAGGVGYLNARNQMMRRYDNLFREAVGELDARQMSELIEAMQTEADTSTLRDPDVAAAKDSLHSLFERFHRYMTDESGVRMGRINQNYFPVVWDTQELANNPQAFKDMLLGKYAGKMERMAAAWERARQKSFAEASPEVQAFMKARGLDATITPEYVANALLENLTRADGVSDALLTAPQREDGVLRPWMSAGEERTLNFIAPEDRAPFLEKDLVKTLTRYVRQGVRTAEYSKRFGRGGAVLGKMLDDAQKELEAASHTMLAAGDLKNEKARADWVRRQFRDVSAATGAMEGSLGNDVPNWLRKTNSWMTVYQNVRLLPLALFSSFVDPLGIVAQGGDMKHAFNTFVEGIKAVARQWGDMLREEPAARKKGQWEQLAEHAGIIDGAVFSRLLNDEYGSVFHDHAAKKINDVMFKANGMDAWNRAMRVGATQAAVQFIERHSRLPEPHSARWLADLGLDAKTLPLDADGHLVTNRHDMQEAFPQMSKPEAEAATLAVHQALARWVEGAILSPNAAQRPAWMSDPHYSMFGHLKQFAYSFHTTIMKRAMNEAKHGNYTPLGVFAWYIPVMIASDVTKGLMLGAGDLPAYMKGYDLGDWMMHGVQRAGVMGMGQMAADTALHPMGMAGPAVEQIADIFMHPVEQNIIRALPVNALYRGALA